MSTSDFARKAAGVALVDFDKDSINKSSPIAQMYDLGGRLMSFERGTNAAETVVLDETDDGYQTLPGGQYWLDVSAGTPFSVKLPSGLTVADRGTRVTLMPLDGDFATDNVTFGSFTLDTTDAAAFLIWDGAQWRCMFNIYNVA
jgi:hypothetical protein